MQDMTVGLQIEVHSKVQTLPEEKKIDTCRVHFRDSHGRRVDQYEQLNHKVIAANKLISIAVHIAHKTPTHGQLKLVTQPTQTQSRVGFEKSTDDMLFVLHLLYYFLASPCSPTENRVILPSGAYGRTVKGFLTWYNQYLMDHHVAPAHHPPLAWLLESDPMLTASRDVSAHFYWSSPMRPVVPRIAPRIMFSGPLERIPALFSAASDGRFSADMRETARSPRGLELRAADLACNFVARLDPQVGEEGGLRRERKLHRLQGFFTLLMHRLLGFVWHPFIHQSEKRSRVTKDDFCFVLQSSLRELREYGLSVADHALLSSKYPLEAQVVDAVWDACRSDIRSGLAHDSNTAPACEDRAELMARATSSQVKDFLEAIFLSDRSKDDYELALMHLEDNGRMLPLEKARDMLGNESGLLRRPIMEYRCEGGTHEKYFLTGSEAADAIQAIYDRLRVLQDQAGSLKDIDMSQNHASSPPMKSLARSEATVSGITRLNLTAPMATREIDDWWHTIGFELEKMS